ncbi:MAG: protein-glutamate O-methyltransferase CheR [Betaproteobacteria bacterium]|nr:protein-glutamate O-methyltransferase CheR [Betaproteobacteria bacterium]
MKPINDAELAAFSQLMFAAAGISLAPSKKALVSGRLQRRLDALGMASFTQYLANLQRDSGERQRAIDLLTTNETYFFREPKHFAFLSEQILPRINVDRPFRVWSAACSSGEEPYSIAMVLAERLGNRPWEILASDISTRVLEQAQTGIYPIERAEHIPKPYLKAYCLKGVGSHCGKFSIDPALRRHTHFRSINLNTSLPEIGEFDLVFLRNVMIYFNADVKKQVCARLIQVLRPDGFLFLGHSESLNGLDCPVTMVQPAIYRAGARADSAHR